MFVCGKMYLKMVDFFGDILNYGWGGSILRVVLVGDFEFSSQHHMKCPAPLQVLLAMLLLIFSLTCLPTAHVSLGLLAGD